jgi:hypothetical protein
LRSLFAADYRHALNLDKYSGPCEASADLNVKVPILLIVWKQARAADKPIGAFV